MKSLKFFCLWALTLASALCLTACQPIQAPAPVAEGGATVTALPVVEPVLETQNVLDVEDDTESKQPEPPDARRGDADDPAIWVHPSDPAQSLVIAALKDGGLDVYNLFGQVVQSIGPQGVRYNNVDVTYGFPLGDRQVDLAVATDRYGDKLVFFAIDPENGELTDVSDPANPLVFTSAGQASDEETTAYGITLYQSAKNGKQYAYVTRRDTSEVGQFELVDNGNDLVGFQLARQITLPEPGGDLEPQAEGMVADHELGVVYIAQEDVGIWKFDAEPDGDGVGALIYPVAPDGDTLEADAEGLTIYYGANGTGYLLASSQGDNRFSVYTREGDNAYLGSFLIGEESTDPTNQALDGAQESDGAQVINVALGDAFRHGLLVVHDGLNQPDFIVIDDGEEENANTNFKFVDWEAVANAFATPLTIDTTSYDPRAGASKTMGVDQIVAIYTLPDMGLANAQHAALPDSIANDRQILLGGVGSDLWHDVGAPVNEFWMVTDRGPNGQIEVDGKNRRTFPVPEFTPHILQVRAEGDVLTLIQSLPILTQSGEPVTGLSNLEGFTEQGWDATAENKLPFDPNGIDTEGLVRTPSGDFWLAEEYAPSILHVDVTGKVVKRFVPEGLAYAGADYEISATLPAIYATRKSNRGFEGSGLSPDGTTLYVVLQSPLSNPDKDAGDVSANTRILAFDLASQQVVGEYVYVFDDPVSYDEPGAPDEMKLSGVVGLDDSTLLILERTDKVAKLYAADLSQATNILGTGWDDPATSPSLEQVSDLAASGVTPLAKRLVIDLSQLPETPEKIEGVAVIDDHTLAIANDNDFNLGDFDAEGNNSNAPGVQSHLLVVTLAEPLR
jgi:3-phytase